MSLLDGYNSLSEDTNKVNSEKAGDDSALVSELSLDMEDEDLIELKNQWLKNWNDYKKELEKKQDKNEEYWLGKQFNEKEGPVDNLIFESLETFLPMATQPKPEPLVEAENSEAGREIANNVRKMLIYQADRLSLNLKLKQTARYWALYFLGAVKIGWSDADDDMKIYASRPQKLILDKDAVIEDGWYVGEYIGEEKTEIASELAAKFPEKADYIKKKVKEKMASKVTYQEWWHDNYVFWTCDNEVLSKAKNPHWNYDTEEEQPVTDPETGGVAIDPETGEQLTETVTVPGRNHFTSPRKPFVFLSVFSLGKHPHDDTNLISQNISLQDLINKRIRQIDKNADNTNGGVVVSGDFFTKEQAEMASESLRKGKAIWVPTGDVNAAIKRDAPTALPNFIYESLVDSRNELRNIFGTRGSTPQGTMNEQTVRGKLAIKGQDSDRTGGGISVYLEQVTDNIFNWMVQMMYVYYDEAHTGVVLGQEQASEHIAIQSSQLTEKLMVSVKEGSMIPKDPLTKRNEAIDLWGQGALDPVTLFDRLEFPNPREAAKNLYLWKVDPIQLFPDLMAQQQAQMAEQQAQEQEMQAEQSEQDQQMRAEEQDNKLEQIEFNNLTKQI